MKCFDVIAQRMIGRQQEETIPLLVAFVSVKNR